MSKIQSFLSKYVARFTQVYKIITQGLYTVNVGTLSKCSFVLGLPSVFSSFLRDELNETQTRKHFLTQVSPCTHTIPLALTMAAVKGSDCLCVLTHPPQPHTGCRCTGQPMWPSGGESELMGLPEHNQNNESLRAERTKQ